MKFTYSAKNQKGEVVSGMLEAAHQEAALSVLQQAGLIVLKIAKKEETVWYARLLTQFQSAGLKDISVFTRQLSTLLEAQVSLVDALQTVYAQTSNTVLRDVIFDMYTDIQAGISFSDALAKQERVFSLFYVNMVRAAELTGRLDAALQYLADYYEQQAYVNGKIRGAMVYPLFIIGLFAVVIGIMVTVVIPQLGTVLLESGVTINEMPVMTRILFSVGLFFQQYTGLVALIALVTVFFLVRYLASDEGSLLVSTLALRMPIIGFFLRNVYVSRFAETLSVLLKGGIPVASALEITAAVVGSVYYQETIMEIAQGVRQGEMISAILAQYPEYFPTLVSQMVAVGEKTGKLEELLRKVSLFYNREVEAMVNNLTEILQPVLIVALGVLIGGLIAAVILPIYQVAQRF